MLIEIWSDVVCPWCYIGKRHLEAALEMFEHRAEVEIRWRSFELDPNAPTDSKIDLIDGLAHKYGTDRDGAAEMLDRVADVAAGVGLKYRFDLAQRANTFNAHRVIHMAQEQGLGDEMKERLLAAYFVEGQAIGDSAVLAELASKIGLQRENVVAMLDSEQFATEVREDRAEAHEMGITGVPFFLIRGGAGVGGAQPPERLLQMLERGWTKTVDETGTVGE